MTEARTRSGLSRARFAGVTTRLFAVINYALTEEPSKRAMAEPLPLRALMGTAAPRRIPPQMLVTRVRTAHTGASGRSDVILTAAKPDREGICHGKLFQQLLD
jgi:hypothetical protein